MRTDLDLYRYLGFPEEVRKAFDDWALVEGINLGERRVRAVRLGEGILECEQFVYPYDVVLAPDGEKEARTEWVAYPVKTVPPLEMFTDDGFVGRLFQSARIDGEAPVSAGASTEPDLHRAPGCDHDIRLNEPGFPCATCGARIDGCRCMCHSPNQPPRMVCVREGRCVLCGAQIDGSGGGDA